MIKAVMFDLGQVIVPFDFKRWYSQIESLSGTPAAEIPLRLRPTGLVQRFESGGIEPRDFARQVSGHLNLETTYERFCEIWDSIFLPETLIAEEMLRGIAGNYRLILLSNTNAIHFEMLRRNYGLLRHFHSLILSYEVKAMKPSPMIYEKAIEASGCAAAECFFTDDIEENVRAHSRHRRSAVPVGSTDRRRTAAARSALVNAPLLP
jgi:putative hydrolase of the HAD superfamily